MRIQKLALALKNDKELNEASESYVSFVTNANPEHWNYIAEARCLIAILEVLEQKGFIAITHKF